MPDSSITHPKETATYYAVVADQGRIFRKVLEAVSALAAIIVGLQFVSAGFYPWEEVFTPMRIIAPASVWGLFAIMLAVTRITVLIINGWWPHTHTARKYISAGFILLVWLPMAASYWYVFQVGLFTGEFRSYPGLGYSVYSLGTEFLIYYGHASFVYVAKRGTHG